MYNDPPFTLFHKFSIGQLKYLVIGSLLLRIDQYDEVGSLPVSYDDWSR